MEGLSSEREWSRLLSKIAAIPHSEIREALNEFAQYVRGKVSQSRAPSVSQTAGINNGLMIGQLFQTYDIRVEVREQAYDVLDPLIRLLIAQMKHTVCISSNSEDAQGLIEMIHRIFNQSLAYEVIDPLGAAAIVPALLNVRLETVRRCDIFIGIYGGQYRPGHTAPRIDEIARLELQSALGQSRRCFLFRSRNSIAEPEQWAYPTFSHFYPPDGCFKVLLEAVRSWVLRTPNSIEQSKLQARYELRRTHKCIAAYNDGLRAAYTALHGEVERTGQFDWYGSPEEFLSKLDEVIDQLQRKDRTGLIPAAVRDRWDKLNQLRGEEIIRQLPFARQAFASPLEVTWRRGSDSDASRDCDGGAERESSAENEASIWSRFLSTAWHIEMWNLYLRLLQSTRQLAEDHSLADIVRIPERLPKQLFDDNSYEYILRTLREWARHIPEPSQLRLQVKSLPRQRRQFGNVEERHRDLQEALGQWEHDVETLKQALESPHFGRCLLLLGRHGSGKTHCVLRMLDSDGDQPAWPLYLTVPRDLVDIETLLCDAASLRIQPSGSGIQWRGVEEIDRYLSGKTEEVSSPSSLVFIFDGLENWYRTHPQFIEEFRGFLETHTQFHSLFFVLTLSESAYHLVVDDEEFWNRYGYVIDEADENPSSLAGWLSLDELNEYAQMWLPIVGVDRVAADYFDPASRRLLSTPLIAWIASESSLLPELPNLNFLDFVERLWKRRQLEITRDLSRRLQNNQWTPVVLRAIWFIAGCLAVEDQTDFGQTCLAQRMSEWDEKATQGGFEPTRLSALEISSQVIAVLREQDLLVPETHDPERIAESGDMLTLDILPFWQYWGGRVLARRLLDSECGLEEFCDERFAPDTFTAATSLKAGLLEFTILWLDAGVGENGKAQERRETAIEFALQLAQGLIRGGSEPRRSVWLAVAKCSSVLQSRLCRWLLEEYTLHLENREDMYCFLFFLKNARLGLSESDLPPHLRFRLLQPHYVSIGDKGLARYLSKLVEYLLADWIGGAEIARAVAYLAGTEAFWIAEEWGQWLYDKLVRLSKTDADSGWRDSLASWMRVMRDGIPAAMQSRDGQNSIRDRDRIWACIMRRFCDGIVDDLGIESLAWLARRGWFRWSDSDTTTPSFIWNVSEEMFTTAMGRWYRNRASHGEREGFVAAVGNLACGEGAQKVTALFLIYHSVPNEKLDRPIDNRLWYMLRRLRDDNDPEVARVWGIGSLAEFYARQSR